MKMFSQVFCEFSNENNYTVYMHMRAENNCCRWFYMCEWSCNLFQPIPWTKELCLKDMTEEKMILKIITRISGFTPNCLWLEWSCLEFQIDLTSNDSLTIHPFFLINAVKYKKMSINLTLAAFLWWIFGCIVLKPLWNSLHIHVVIKIITFSLQCLFVKLTFWLHIDFSFFLGTNCSWIFSVRLFCAASQGLGSWKNSTPIIAGNFRDIEEISELINVMGPV